MTKIYRQTNRCCLEGYREIDEREKGRERERERDENGIFGESKLHTLTLFNSHKQLMLKE